MSKRFIFTVLTIVVIGLISAFGVFLAKGYTFSTTSGRFVGTGIISITSQPDGASIYLDGHLTTATNANISSLKPKTYDVKVVKDGFIPWEKQVEVKEGLVTDVKITLFPAIPTIYPLTFNGVANPVLSQDGSKLAFAVPIATTSSTLARQKGGIWVWSMVSQPISFNRSAEPHQIVASTQDLDFTKATIRWSPDSKQILATLQEGGNQSDSSTRNYLLNPDNLTQASDLRDITPTIASTLKAWDDDQKSKDAAAVLALKDSDVQKLASSSAILKWSPDATMFIHRQQPLSLAEKKPEANLTGFKVYDTAVNKKYDLPEAKSYMWLPDSRHIILVQDGKIAISEYDGTNVDVIFAGNFMNSFVFPWPDLSRLVIISFVPTPTASQPNLFGINLK
ncbi:PEGA domain-containing protein [Candidatus Daviesbacteria bacterium]|nr:PEGA domain-containing protein [Candidatus Daviesbacteria bacterium]